MFQHVQSRASHSHNSSKFHDDEEDDDDDDDDYDSNNDRVLRIPPFFHHFSIVFPAFPGLGGIHHVGLGQDAGQQHGQAADLTLDPIEIQKGCRLVS